MQNDNPFASSRLALMTGQRECGVDPETWAVFTNLCGEPASRDSCREIARARRDDHDAGYAIRDEWCLPHAQAAGPTTGLLGDLIDAALQRVDWAAIGQAFRTS